MHKVNPVGWFEIYVQDMDRAKRFYEMVLQTQLVQLDATIPDMWCFPMDDEAYGAPGALFKMQGVPSGPGGTLVYFSVEDCAEAEPRVEANGGRVYKPKFSIEPWGFTALIFDTEGNMIGLHSKQ